MKDKVVYTCITGGYDELKNHTYIDPEWDYVCFTDDLNIKNEENNVWELRPLLFDRLDNVRNQRWHKIHPHILLKNYKESLYLDTNIDVLSADLFKHIGEIISKKQHISLAPHFERRNIYDEFEICRKLGKDKISILNEQEGEIRKTGFGGEFGVFFENNIIYRRHNDIEIIKIMEEWWWWVENYSRRDQLSLIYVLWKNNYNIKPLYRDSYRNTDFIRLIYKHTHATPDELIKQRDDQKRYYELMIKKLENDLNHKINELSVVKGDIKLLEDKLTSNQTDLVSTKEELKSRINELDGIYASKAWNFILLIRRFFGVMKKIINISIFSITIIKGYILSLLPDKIKDFLKKYSRSIIYRFKIDGITKILIPLIPRGGNVKRVIIYNAYFPTLGGGEKEVGFLCKFIEDFYKGNVEVFVLTHNYKNVSVKDKNYPKIENLEKMLDIRLEKTSLLKLDCYDIQHERVRDFIKTADLFINFTFLSTDKGLGKRNIYRCMFPPRNNKTKFLDSYDYITPNSSYSDFWFKKYWNYNKPTKVIYPPVFYKEDLKDSYSESKKENIILHVGRFFVGGHSKKQDALVNFFISNHKKLKGFELHLAGRVSDYLEDQEYLERIKKKASGYPIFFHISSSTQEIKDLYTKAKIYWHATGLGEKNEDSPEKNEHFGITVVEAMANGAVPIIINKGGAPEIITDGKNGFLWNTEKECIDKTLKIISDENKRIDIARQAVETSYIYSVEKFNEGFEEILKNI